MSTTSADALTLADLAADFLDYAASWTQASQWQKHGLLLGWRWGVLAFAGALPLVWALQFLAPRRCWLPLLSVLSLAFVAFTLSPWPVDGVVAGSVGPYGVAPAFAMTVAGRAVLGLVHAGLLVLALVGVYRLARAAASRCASAGCHAEAQRRHGVSDLGTGPPTAHHARASLGHGTRPAGCHAEAQRRHGTRPAVAHRTPSDAGWKPLYHAVAVLATVFGLLFVLRTAALRSPPGGPATALWIVLPDFHEAGLAFVFVRAVHYVWDSYRGRIVQHNWWRFLAWMTFFPTYRVGPIERYHDFCTQILRCRRRWRPADLLVGAGRIVTGLACALLATYFAVRAVDIGMALQSRSATTIPYLHLWILGLLPMLMAYLFLYSYSEMAIGLCRMIGYRAAENFRWSLLSHNLAELWDRTHISMSRCLRDYCYLPLVRRGPFRRRPPRTGEALSAPAELGRLVTPSANYFITFVICGLWHAPSLQAVAWGVLMACGMVVFDVWTWLRQRAGRAKDRPEAGPPKKDRPEAGPPKRDRPEAGPPKRDRPEAGPPKRDRPEAGRSETAEGLLARMGRSTVGRAAGRVFGVLLTFHFFAFTMLAVYNPPLFVALLAELVRRPLSGLW